MTVTAIVLAGGRSRRFGGDKLAAAIGDRSVLQATIGAVSGLADDVVVAGARLPDGLAGDVPVRLVQDVAPFEGPLAALANVLRLAEPHPGDLVIVVGGDMPGLVPRVLVSMLDALDADPTIDAVYLGRPAAGEDPQRRQVLPLALRLEPAQQAAREAAGAGERSLQACVDRLAHAELPPARWLRLDPGARTLVDIDTPADLDRLG